jgi:hypothetical protein
MTLISKFTKSMKDIPRDLKTEINHLKELRDDLDCIFEWHDGILVEAM